MPIYEYRCQDCDGVTEAFLKNRQEAADVRCQQCGSERLERAYLTSIASIPTDTQSAKGRSALDGQEGIPCCGSQEGCSNPKRCCQQ